MRNKFQNVSFKTTATVLLGTAVTLLAQPLAICQEDILSDLDDDPLK